MLPHEIEPFAEWHIQRLESVAAEINKLTYTSLATVEASTLDEWRVVVQDAASALTRFKVCMADEVATKQKAVKACKENHIYPYQKADS